MLDADTRLRAILHSYKLRFQGESDLKLLKRIDAQLVPLLLDTIEFLPTTKLTVEGFVTLTQAIDRQLAENGYPAFNTNEKMNKGRAYFLREDVTIDRVRELLPKYQELRQELWDTVKIK